MSDGKKYYPLPGERELKGPPIFWHRGRIVIPAFTFDDAVETAEKISEFCSCQVERLFCISDCDATEAYSETVIERRDFPLKLQEARPAGPSKGEAQE